VSSRPGRLKRRADFLRVAAGRRKFVAPGLILQALEAPSGRSESNAMRIGFTVSRKVGISVARNRARRRLKAVAEMMEGHAATGYDYVLIGRGGTLTRPFADLRNDLVTALRRLGLYREDGDDARVRS
jgi:ribonuclease P protein component